MEFFCNLEVPRSDGRVGIPARWMFDDTGRSASLAGFLFALLAEAEPGIAVAGSSLVAAGRNDPPLLDLIAEGEQLGYLVTFGDGRYELVHPARLGHLPKP